MICEMIVAAVSSEGWGGGVKWWCCKVSAFKQRDHKSKHEANLASIGTRVNLIRKHLRLHLATRSRESATTESFAAAAAATPARVTEK